MQRGFHPRLGARPLRDTIEKHLRGAVADAILAEEGSNAFEVTVCGDELALLPFHPSAEVVNRLAVSYTGPTSPT